MTDQERAAAIERERYNLPALEQERQMPYLPQCEVRSIGQPCEIWTVNIDVVTCIHCKRPLNRFLEL